MRVLSLRRRSHHRVRPLGEDECYARCHGERTSDLQVLRLEPRRPRHPVLVSGEAIRARFEERLDGRGEEQA